MRGWCTALTLVDIAFFSHPAFRFKVYALSCFSALEACIMSAPLDGPKNFSLGIRTVQLLVGEKKHKYILILS